MEDSLIQQAQAGDTQAFRALIERYHTPVWQTAQVLLRDRGAIEDAMQEIWLDVWRGLPGFQRERPFRPWLLTIVANRCHMTTRRRRFSWQILENAQAEEIFASDDVVAEVLRQESDSELQAALQHISEDQKRVLELRFFADLDLSEIALIIRVPVGTVKSRLHRGLASLRRYLQTTHASKERDL